MRRCVRVSQKNRGMVAGALSPLCPALTQSAYFAGYSDVSLIVLTTLATKENYDKFNWLATDANSWTGIGTLLTQALDGHSGLNASTSISLPRAFLFYQRGPEVHEIFKTLIGTGEEKDYEAAVKALTHILNQIGIQYTKLTYSDKPLNNQQKPSMNSTHAYAD